MTSASGPMFNVFILATGVGGSMARDASSAISAGDSKARDTAL